MQLYLSLHGALFVFVCSVIVNFSIILEGLALCQFLECLFTDCDRSKCKLLKLIF